MALVILVLILFGLVYAAFAAGALWLVLDSMASAFRWVGIDEPIFGWVAVGLLFGALIGLTIGLQRAGRPLNRIAVRVVGVALVAALLFAGDRASATTRPVFSSSTAVPAGPLNVRVLDNLTVRAGPSTDARVLGTVAPNAVLPYIRQTESGDWYEVSIRGRNGRVFGWVSSRYVSKPTPP